MFAPAARSYRLLRRSLLKNAKESHQWPQFFSYRLVKLLSSLSRYSSFVICDLSVLFIDSSMTYLWFQHRPREGLFCKGRDVPLFEYHVTLVRSAINRSGIWHTFGDAALPEVVDSIATEAASLLEIVNYNGKVSHVFLMAIRWISYISQIGSTAVTRFASGSWLHTD